MKLWQNANICVKRIFIWKKLLKLQNDNVLWKNMSRIIAFCDIGTENNILRT